MPARTRKKIRRKRARIGLLVSHLWGAQVLNLFTRGALAEHFQVSFVWTDNPAPKSEDGARGSRAHRRIWAPYQETGAFSDQEIRDLRQLCVREARRYNDALPPSKRDHEIEVVQRIFRDKKTALGTGDAELLDLIDYHGVHGIVSCVFGGIVGRNRYQDIYDLLEGRMVNVHPFGCEMDVETSLMNEIPTRYHGAKAPWYIIRDVISGDINFAKMALHEMTNRIDGGRVLGCSDAVSPLLYRWDIPEGPEVHPDTVRRLRALRLSRFVNQMVGPAAQVVRDHLPYLFGFGRRPKCFRDWSELPS